MDRFTADGLRRIRCFIAAALLPEWAIPALLGSEPILIAVGGVRPVEGAAHLTVGTGERAVFIEDEMRWAEATAPLAVVNQACHQLRLTLAGLVNLMEQFG